MLRAVEWICAAGLTGGVAASAITVPTATAATASPSSSDAVPAALVLRGSSTAAARDTTASDGGAPAVLRGSPRSVKQPNAGPPSCPLGFEYDAALGCVSPAAAYGLDHGWWPYDGFGLGGFERGPGRRLRHRSAHAEPKRRIFRAGVPALRRFARAFAPSVIGHR